MIIFLIAIPMALVATFLRCTWED